MQYTIHNKFEQSMKYLKSSYCLISYKYIKRKQTSLTTNQINSNIRTTCTDALSDIRYNLKSHHGLLSKQKIVYNIQSNNVNIQSHNRVPY